jgi:hypothetical protein
MLFSIVWMDSVGHVCGNHETIPDDSEIIFFRHITFEVE